MIYTALAPALSQCSCGAVVADQAAHDAFHANLIIPIISASVPAQVLITPTPPVLIPTPVPAPTLAPVPGNRAKIASGLHVDNNVYGSGNSSANAFASGEKFVGLTFPWSMLETASGIWVAQGNIQDLLNDPAGNYADGRVVPRMVFSLFGSFDGVSCAQVAAGAVDANLINMCNFINGIPFPQIAIRPGWECDGGWFNWSADPPSFKAMYAHVRTVMNAHLTLARTPGGVWWEWNAFAQRGSPTAKNSYGFSTMDYFPGPDVVDVVGCDSYRVNNDPSDTAWLVSMQAAAAFAAAQGLRVGFSEWGLWDAYQGSPATLESSGASVKAVNNMMTFCDSLPADGQPGSLAYQIYFDANPGTGQYALHYFPLAVAALRARLLQP